MDKTIRQVNMAGQPNGGFSDIPEKSADSRQIHFIVDGCKVKLNFLSEPDSTAISDVKRMMVGGV